jgi:hypothetical protein
MWCSTAVGFLRYVFDEHNHIFHKPEDERKTLPVIANCTRLHNMIKKKEKKRVEEGKNGRKISGCLSSMGGISRSRDLLLPDLSMRRNPQDR